MKIKYLGYIISFLTPLLWLWFLSTFNEEDNPYWTCLILTGATNLLLGYLFSDENTADSIVTTSFYYFLSSIIGIVFAVVVAIIDYAMF